MIITKVSLNKRSRTLVFVVNGAISMTMTMTMTMMKKRYWWKSGYPPCRVPPGAISGDVMVHRWLAITLLTRNLHKNISAGNFTFIWKNKIHNELWDESSVDGYRALELEFVGFEQKWSLKQYQCNSGPPKVAHLPFYIWYIEWWRYNGFILGRPIWEWWWEWLSCWGPPRKEC